MKKVNSPVIAKTASQRGKWVYKPTRSAVIVCACGNKYIVTKKNQKVCILCLRNI